MTTTSDWERWSDRWRAEGVSDAELAAMVDRVARARRSMALVGVASLAVVVVALAVIAAALRHAANVFEAALGVVVGLGIVAAWVADARNARSSWSRPDASLDEYLRVRQALCLRRMRLARLVWVVAALDFVFLVPWWIGGFKVHGFGFHPLQILTLWLPLAVITALVAWAVRSYAAARVEEALLRERTRMTLSD
jgi:hypothetical protein